MLIEESEGNRRSKDLSLGGRNIFKQILAKSSGRLSIGFIWFRSIELSVFIKGAELLHLLSVLPVSQENINPSMPNSYFKHNLH
jgi:hypothetical protein